MSKRHSPITLKDLMPVILAIIGLGGTIATAYFTFRSQVAPKELEISATQTAEYALTRNRTIAPTNTQFPSLIDATASPSPTVTSMDVTSFPTATPIDITPSANSYTIVISEVMASPCGVRPDGSDTFWNEYVEIYNYGNKSIDVNGWWISDGDKFAGNPDIIVSWETRHPGISFGNNLGTSSTIIPPGKVAIILSPKYLSGDVKFPEFLKPYIFPEGTIILTIANGDVLGSDDFGIEVVQIHNPVILYQGTDNEIYQVISTYGSPIITGSPTNIRDDEKDSIPLVLDDCYARTNNRRPCRC